MLESRGSGSSLPLWLKNFELTNFSPLEEDLSAEVCVVGGGIAGLSCAYNLTSHGIDTVLLEDGNIGGGETSRTTGHLSNALDDHYYELERVFGVEGSRIAAESHASAIKFIANLVQSEEIDCQFNFVDAFLFLPPGESISFLNKELQAVHKAGITDAEIVSRSPIESFDTGPCIRFPNQAEFSPLPYLSALTRLISKNGGKIFTNTHVEEFNNESSNHIVRTSNGKKVTAKHVIIATNSPIYDRLTMHTKLTAYRTFVIAGKIPKNYVPKGLYYDTLDPYHYIRTVSSTPNEDYLVIGGEDHRTGHQDDANMQYDILEAWSRERFPLLKEIEFKWSGQIMEPVDCLAFIGRYPHKENVFLATGDSGNGLTHGTIAGLLISDLIRGKENAWEKLYAPRRKSFTTIPDFVQENVDTLMQYTDWISGKHEESVKNIELDSGAIVDEGFGKGKLAVYRDAAGQFHTRSAICPHLGGVVRWNPAEKSWDCPCHGSRFDCYGKVLHGPAIRSLKHVSIDPARKSDS